MPIEFSEIPSNLRVPLAFVEIDGSRAQQGLSVRPWQALAIGQRLTAGTKTAGQLVQVTDAAQADTFFGKGSMLARMCRAYLAKNRSNDLWAVALDDNAAGVAAAGSITFAGTATKAGTIQLWVAGQLVQTAVAVGDTAANVVLAIAANLPASSDLPVTGAQDGVTQQKLNLTAKHKGEVGNNIDVRLNYQRGQELPAGITVSAQVAMAGGTSNPSLTPAITALPDERYHVLAFPYTDASSVAALETELDSRWNAMRAIPTFALSAAVGTLSALGVLGNSYNTKHLSIMAASGSPTPTYEWAGVLAAIVAFYGNQDPARPFNTLELTGVLPPATADQFDLLERNTLLYDGISTPEYAAGGKMQVQRLITTYKTNVLGAPDIAFLDANYPLLTATMRETLVSHIKLKFARTKLAGDGGPPISGVVTPSRGKAEAMVVFEQWRDEGWVQDIEAFKQALEANIDPGDPTRLQLLLQPKLVSGLHGVDAVLAFLLS